jgi:hypothetical protein
VTRPCTRDLVYATPPDPLVTVPSEVLVGVATQVKTRLAEPSFGFASRWGFTLELSPASNQPLSHPYSRTGPSSETAYVPVHFEPGDGPARLTVWWDEDEVRDYFGPCRWTFSKVITPRDPSTPSLIGPDKTTAFGYNFEDALEWTFDVANSLPKPVSLTVRWRGSKATIATTPWSYEAPEPKWTGTRTTHRFILDGSEDGSKPYVEFRRRERANPPGTKGTAFWSSSFNGGVLARGSFRVRVRAKHGKHGKARHKIWEGTDAFFNYCLKKHKDVISQGGRLYCWSSGRKAVPGFSVGVIDHIKTVYEEPF